MCQIQRLITTSIPLDAQERQQEMDQKAYLKNQFHRSRMIYKKTHRTFQPIKGKQRDKNFLFLAHTSKNSEKIVK